MSIHSYTLKSLFFLTLLLQISCSTNKHKTPVELAAAELDATLDMALVAFKNEAEDTKEKGRALEALKKKAEKVKKEAEDTFRQLTARTEKLLTGVDSNASEEELRKKFKPLAEERRKRFKTLSDKLEEADKYATAKFLVIEKLPEGPKKYNEIIKCYPAFAKFLEVAAKFNVALYEELEKKSK